MGGVQVAVKGYAAALACCATYDTRAVLRLVQLWLAHSTDDAVCSYILPALNVRTPLAFCISYCLCRLPHAWGRKTCMCVCNGWLHVASFTAWG